MASFAKLDGKWRALIRRKGHKPISKRFDTKQKAIEWARAIEAQIDSGQAPKLPQTVVTVASLIQIYRDMRADSRPILDTSNEHYQLNTLKADLGDLNVMAMTTEDLVGWAKQRREQGAGPYTINLDLSKMGTVFRYAGEGLPDVIGKARPTLSYLGLIGGGGRRERRPTGDELERLLEWLHDERGGLYAEALLFAVLTAMRRGEVTRIVWKDVDEAKRLVLVRDRKDPRNKAGNDQWVPLLGEAWDVLQRQPKDDERIFPIHPQTLSKYFREGCVALGIPDLHFHDMRHEGTSRLFEEGFGIQHVALVTGHRDWRHLRRYTNLKPESLHALGKSRDIQQRPDDPQSASGRPRKS